MARVLIPIADGTEEMEAVTVIDVLRRAQVEVCVASVMADRKEVVASRGVRLIADELLGDCIAQTWDMIVLPGGMPGASHLHDCSPLIQLLRDQVASGRWLAAICASPAVVLGRHQLIPHATATCFPSFQAELSEQTKSLSQERVVVDDKLITSQGPGTAVEFALALVEALSDKDKRAAIAKEMVVA